VSLSNVDNDTAGISVDAIDTLSHEDGATARVSYVLNSSPTANVVITLASSDLGEGTAAPTTLTFTRQTGPRPRTSM
jgi:hypothetical protein